MDRYTFYRPRLLALAKKARKTKAGSLEVLACSLSTYGSANDSLSGPDIPSNTPLDMNTPLYLLTKPDKSHYTSVDVSNIKEQLG